MMERIGIFLINIFFPPLSVMILAGPGTDCIINTLFFIAGVIPAHIHGFYISCTYFHRKRKVKKGRYPGGRKAGIWSQQVLNGGASNAHVKELWQKQEEDRMKKDDEAALKRKSSRMSRSGRSDGRKL